MVAAGCEADSYRGEYDEKHRPQVHFTPATGWMNDPNGLVYFGGEYHLFYQYLPRTVESAGLKRWGHSVSRDLVHWQHLPVALTPHGDWGIWSGSAIVDWNNTSGLQDGEDPALVAVFTENSYAGQRQSIAFSNDRGRTWAMYPGNPVLSSPGLRDFRDPKVFWHEETRRWVMVLAAGDRVMLYTSTNLRDWQLASGFGSLDGSHAGVWECPDLFRLPVDGEGGEIRWVLLVSVSDGAPSGGSGTQYFVGDFDGTTFVNEAPATETRWIDYGKDNYAAVTFSDIPPENGRRVLIGWMSNWTYARDVPTAPWRGAMTLPRGLTLHRSPTGRVELISAPVVELAELRESACTVTDATIAADATLSVASRVPDGAFEVAVTFLPGTATEFGLTIANGVGEHVAVGYNVEARKVFIDRRHSGDSEFSWQFTQGLHAAPLDLESETLTLHILVDWSSIEVFAEDGRAVLTDLVFPSAAYDRVALYAMGGDARVLSCEVWQLHSIW